MPYRETDRSLLIAAVIVTAIGLSTDSSSKPRRRLRSGYFLHRCQKLANPIAKPPRLQPAGDSVQSTYAYCLDHAVSGIVVALSASIGGERE
jgi:hypothetical protein